MSIYLPIIKNTGAKEEIINIKEETIIIIFIILSFLKNFFIFILINIILIILIKTQKTKSQILNKSQFPKSKILWILDFEL